MKPRVPLALAALLVVSVANAWTPSHRPATRHQPTTKQQLLLADFRPVHWAAAGIMAASIAFTPLPTLAADAPPVADPPTGVKVDVETTTLIKSIQENKGELNAAVSSVVKDTPSENIQLSPPPSKAEAVNEALNANKKEAAPVVKEEPKAGVKEAPKVEEPKKEEPKVEVKKEEPKVEKLVEAPVVKVEAKKEEPKVEVKKEEPKVEVKKEESKVEKLVEAAVVKVEAKKEEPKVEVKEEAPKVKVVEAPVVKAEEPKPAEEKKPEAPAPPAKQKPAKVEEPKAVEPKKEPAVVEPPKEEPTKEPVVVAPKKEPTAAKPSKEEPKKEPVVEAPQKEPAAAEPPKVEPKKEPVVEAPKAIVVQPPKKESEPAVAKKAPTLLDFVKQKMTTPDSPPPVATTTEKPSIEPASKVEAPTPVAPPEAPKATPKLEASKEVAKPEASGASVDGVENVLKTIIAPFKETKEEATKTNFDDVAFWNRPAIRTTLLSPDGEERQNLVFTNGEVASGLGLAIGATYLASYQLSSASEESDEGAPKTVLKEEPKVSPPRPPAIKTRQISYPTEKAAASKPKFPSVKVTSSSSIPGVSGAAAPKNKKKPQAPKSPVGGGSYLDSL